MPGRELTYDEKKAAEAAFRGLPVDPSWSSAARSVYQGIVNALHGQPSTAVMSSQSAGEPASDASGHLDEIREANEDQEPARRMLNRQEAIEAGILVDVSSIAEQIGLRLSVGITKPLWDHGITAAGQVSEEECRSRVRDVLIAFRLYIEHAEITAPWIKFPALLSIPPDAEPQVCSLVAIAHRDSTAPRAVTLLFPDEMSGLSIAE